MRIIGVFLASVFAVGCYATASTGYTPAYVGPSVAVTATTVGPDLVYVSPGVQVIANFDEPIFYSDGFYWRESGGVWYRSSYHTGGWVSYRAPHAVYSIRDRHSYRHYRPAGYTPRSRDNRTYRHDNRPDNRAVRHDNRPDNRTYGNNRPDARPAPAVKAAPKRDNRPDPRKDKDDKKDHRR